MFCNDRNAMRSLTGSVKVESLLVRFQAALLLSQVTLSGKRSIFPLFNRESSSISVTIESLPLKCSSEGFETKDGSV